MKVLIASETQVLQYPHAEFTGAKYGRIPRITYGENIKMHGIKKRGLERL
jgi:hypothetical protein